MSTRYVWNRYKIETSYISQRIYDNSVSNTQKIIFCGSEPSIDEDSGLYIPSGTRREVSQSEFYALDSYGIATNMYPYAVLCQSSTGIGGDRYCEADYKVSNYEWRVESNKLVYSRRAASATELLYTFRIKATQEKGTLLGPISGTSQSSYPSDGVQGSYWYTYLGSDSIDPTAVGYNKTTPKGGESIIINVTPRSNTYGGTITYKYEVQLDNGSWTNIGSTTSTAKSYIIPKGTTTFRARVVASDNMGFTSSTYTTGNQVTVINNSAPSTPSSISVPSSVQAGKAFTVSWGTSTDSDGNLSGYILQRSLNGGSYSTIYTGSSRSYQDTIPKSGYTSVTYRVQAYDTDGATSSYRTSNTVTVINNVAPVISGSNQNLGVFTYNPPTISYIVTDENNDTVTVTTKLDSSTLETKTVILGQTYTVPINWWDINTGSHTVTITANDGQGGIASRTYTFTKNSVGQISFNRLRKKTDTGYQTTYIETDSDSIITNNGQILSERLESIAAKLSVSISSTPSEMVSRHRLHIKLTSEYTIDYLEMYSTNVKVGSSTVEDILTRLENKVGISNSGTIPSDLNFERWRMKNSSGSYDIIYLEGVSEHIVCPCGKTVEERLVAIEAKL